MYIHAQTHAKARPSYFLFDFLAYKSFSIFSHFYFYFLTCIVLLHFSLSRNRKSFRHSICHRLIGRPHAFPAFLPSDKHLPHTSVVPFSSASKHWMQHWKSLFWLPVPWRTSAGSCEEDGDFWVPWRERNILNSWSTIIFWRMILCPEVALLLVLLYQNYWPLFHGFREMKFIHLYCT